MPSVRLLVLLRCYRIERTYRVAIRATMRLPNIVATRRCSMPIVRIEMWPGRTKAQKREMARAITDVVCNVAHTTPDQTIIVFTDVSKDQFQVPQGAQGIDLHRQ